MLTEITADKCPDCNAKIRREVKENQHCNGYWNETVEFECGCELHFSPNFMRIAVEKKCPNTEEIKEFYSKREKALEKIRNYISKQDVDKEFIDYILRNIQYILAGRW